MRCIKYEKRRSKDPFLISLSCYMQVKISFILNHNAYPIISISRNVQFLTTVPEKLSVKSGIRFSDSQCKLTWIISKFLIVTLGGHSIASKTTSANAASASRNRRTRKVANAKVRIG